ncbi:hypothetical protein MQA28_26100 [Escherichia coli]|nr:hypothetical protein [Escherichia coli]
MKLIFLVTSLLGFVAVKVSAQRTEYDFQYHHTDVANLLLITHDTYDFPSGRTRLCYLVVVDDSWNRLIQDNDSYDAIKEDIINLIKNDDPQHLIPPAELEMYFHDTTGADECHGIDVHLILYTPPSDLIIG